VIELATDASFQTGELMRLDVFDLCHGGGVPPRADRGRSERGSQRGDFTALQMQIDALLIRNWNEPTAAPERTHVEFFPEYH
jgi:hypothetical protein